MSHPVDRCYNDMPDQNARFHRLVEDKPDEYDKTGVLRRYWICPNCGIKVTETIRTVIEDG